MANPRSYTDFDSCVQPMRRGDIIVGYRRIGVRALLRNALIESTVANVGLKPFGLYISQNTSQDIFTPGSINTCTRQMITRLVDIHPQLSASVLEAVCGILSNLSPSHMQCFNASKVPTGNIFSPLLHLQTVRIAWEHLNGQSRISMSQLKALAAIAHISQLRIINGAAPYFEVQ